MLETKVGCRHFPSNFKILQQVMGEKCAQNVPEAQRRNPTLNGSLRFLGRRQGLAVCAESEAKEMRLGRNYEVCGS